MKRHSTHLSERYRTALQRFLGRGGAAGLGVARELGKVALKTGMQTLELAKLHEEILLKDILPGNPLRSRVSAIRRAGHFFAAAMTPIESTHRSTRETVARQKKFIETLSRRTVELASSNRELNREIIQRKAVEAALKSSERHHMVLLGKSDQLQVELRRLSRQILSAQEDERRQISRELHDVVAQTLTGINIRLATLMQESSHNTKSMGQNINLTQKLVEKSVDIVHQFARELRPAVLDDLGLIPALRSFMKAYSIQTGISCRLTASSGVERLDTVWRTVLYRVAQEALTNVSRHAKATRVEIVIQDTEGAVSLKIRDNGRSFNVDKVLNSSVEQHLGMLGMRERVEMAGGRFDVVSTVGQGTLIQVRIPFEKPVGTHKKTTTKDKGRKI